MWPAGTPGSDAARSRREVRAAAAIVATLALAACGEDAPKSTPPAPAPLGPSVIRLLDDVESANVVLPPTARASEPPRALFSLADELEAVGCVPEGTSHRCEGSASRGFHGPVRGERVFARFSVPPSTVLRYELRGGVTSSPCGGVEIAELDAPADEVRVGGRLWQSRIVHVHRPSFEAPGRGRRLAGTFLTGLRTRSIALALTPAADCTARVETLLVEVPDAPAPQLVRRGYLLAGHSRADAPDETLRRALALPAGGEASFQVTVPRGGRLHFDASPAPEMGAEGEARMAVRVALDGTVRARWSASREVHPDGSGYRFEGRDLDLRELAGREVTITFAVSRGVALFAEPRVVRPRADGERPIVWIAVDTLRADRAPCGSGPVPTPHLDALERESVCFSEAEAASNWTVPSFASLFTGLPPSQHRVLHWDHHLSEAHETFTERLAAAGWTTHAIVYKSPLKYVGFDRGFDAWLGGTWTSAVRAERTVDEALAWLDEHGETRFFLFLHFNDPHQPFNQPRESLSEEDRRWLTEQGLDWPLARLPGLRCGDCGEPALGYDAATRARMRRLYDGEIAYLDGELGRLFEGLRARGIWDDAVIAFASDHGESMWERGTFFGHGDNVFAGELTRVPLMIRASGLAPRREDRPVSSLGFASTLLTQAGVSRPRMGVAGDLLTGTPNVAIVAEDGWGFDFRARAGAEALVVDERGGGLFDRRADPRERRDLSDARPERVRALRWLGARTLRERAGAFVQLRAEAPIEDATIVGAEPSWSAESPDGRERLWAFDCAARPVRLTYRSGGAARERRLDDWGDAPAEGTVAWRRGCAEGPRRGSGVDADTLRSLRQLGYAE